MGMYIVPIADFNYPEMQNIVLDVVRTSTNPFFEGSIMSSSDKIPIELERQLMELGLTNYQARVYRAVYILKECSISQIASYSKVPTAKVYSVVSDLKEMGLLAEIPKSRPVTFKAFAPDQYIEREKNKIVEIGDQIKKNLATLEKFQKERATPEEHKTLLIENEFLIKNLIFDTLSSLPEDVLFVIHDDLEFYKDILSRLMQELKSHGSISVSVTLLDPYERQLEFLQTFPELNIQLLTPQELLPEILENLKKIPLLFIVDKHSFINITQTDQRLEYLYLKSKTFADFLRTSLKKIKKPTLSSAGEDS